MSKPQTLQEARQAYAVADAALTAARNALAAYESSPGAGVHDGDTGEGADLYAAETDAYNAWLDAEDAVWVAERNESARLWRRLWPVSIDDELRLQEEVRSR